MGKSSGSRPPITALLVLGAPCWLVLSGPILERVNVTAFPRIFRDALDLVGIGFWLSVLAAPVAALAYVAVLASRFRRGWRPSRTVAIVVYSAGVLSGAYLALRILWMPMG